MKNSNILLGAHISVAGGFDKSIDRAEEIKTTCMQIFTKSNRQWYAKTITKDEQDAFVTKLKQSSVQVVVAHAAYLINLGSSSEETVEKSIKSLSEELQRCEQLNIPYLVLHPGTARFDDETKSLEFIAHQLNKAITRSKTTHVMVLLETMAGQGNTVGQTFEQLATIIKHTEHKRRVGVCFDTCHAFVAGYDFSTPALYKAMWHEFDKTIGLHKLKAFHINDSKKDLESKIDRHEDIGKGKIPLEAFSLIMNDRQFADIPKIIETPKGDDLQSDKKNIEKLKNLVK